ncbi:hypothetical protein ACNQVK_01495 [Mycobacterium sp. 134]|uniref:hypothetical protein n=1 Tax=Mycobacterium sp. 134 TaxID=3400425 RepID=UPI003AAD4A8F
MTGTDTDKRGLYRTYELSRLDEDGRHRHEVTDPFFPLLYATDPYARVALEAYANACARESPKVAQDLYRALGIDIEVEPTGLTEELVRHLARSYPGRWVALREEKIIAAGDSIERARAGVTDGKRFAVLYAPHPDDSTTQEAEISHRESQGRTTVCAQSRTYHRLPDETACPDCGCTVPIYYRRDKEQDRVAVYAWHTTTGDLSATIYDEICPNGGSDYPKA